MKSEAFLKNLAKQYVNETGEMYKHENAVISPAPTPRMDGKMWAARRRQKWKAHRHIFMSIAASIVMLVVVGIAFLPEILQDNAPMPANESIANDAAMNFGAATGAADGVSPTPPPAPPATEAAPPPAADIADDTIVWHQAEVPEEDDLLNMDFALPEDGEWEPPAIAAPAMPPGIAQISLTPPPGWQIVYTDFDGNMTIFHLEGAAQNRVIVMAATPPEENDFSQFFPVLINDTWAHMRIESTHSVLIYQLDGVQFTLTTAYDYQDLITLAHSWIA